MNESLNTLITILATVVIVLLVSAVLYLVVALPVTDNVEQHAFKEAQRHVHQ